MKKNVLIIGAGGVAQVVAHKCAQNNDVLGDLHIASRDIKRPWEVGKAFDASAPCGPLTPVSRIGHPSKGKIVLKCNGKVRQDGDLAQMI